jgi:glutamyl-tRNA synthetase
MSGRFAPSPTGDLHIGNLRTAAIAWLSARSQGRPFLVRMEDLDRHQSSGQHEQAQLRDLAAIGLDWDGQVVRQSDRFDRYDRAIAELDARGLVYECFCTRREIHDEIQSAPHAPHGPPGSYPGTCRDLSADERAARRDAGRHPAVRLRADGRTVTFEDRVCGVVTGVADDVVLRRSDGVPAYNLAVVVDDAAQAVTEVVRGDDLAPSTPRQLLLQELLGLPAPTYAHVPLVVDARGDRLAKRNGSVMTLADLRSNGVPASVVVQWILTSIGGDRWRGAATLREVLAEFDVRALRSGPVPAPPFVVDGR